MSSLIQMETSNTEDNSGKYFLPADVLQALFSQIFLLSKKSRISYIEKTKETKNA